jgi:phage terminase small subunit
MPILENGKHELFAQKWHETENKSEAYRYAYPGSTKWTTKTLHNKASELSKLNEVAGRYNELKQETADNHGVTIASLLRELDEARGIALQAETPQSSAAVSATMSKAKLVGLDINRSVVVELSHEQWLDQLK